MSRVACCSVRCSTVAQGRAGTRTTGRRSPLQPMPLSRSRPSQLNRGRGASTHAWRLGRIKGTESDQIQQEAEEVDGSEIPDEVWQAEADAAPGRNIRLGLYAAIGAGSGFLAVGRIQFLATQEVRTLGDAVWPVLDIAAVGIAAYFAVEDLKNRDENVKRIWAEVQKRGAEKYAPATPQHRAFEKMSERTSYSQRAETRVGAGRGPNREQAKGKRKSSAKEVKGFGGKTAKGAKAVDAAAAATSAPPEKKGGVLSGVKKLVAEANDEARIQALQMNQMLEEKGVLKPLDQPPKDP